MSSNFSSRFKELRLFLDISVQEMGKRTKIEKQSIYTLEKREADVRASIVDKACKTFPEFAEWLVTGEYDPRKFQLSPDFINLKKCNFDFDGNIRTFASDYDVFDLGNSCSGDYILKFKDIELKKYEKITFIQNSEYMGKTFTIFRLNKLSKRMHTKFDYFKHCDWMEGYLIFNEFDSKENLKGFSEYLTENNFNREKIELKKIDDKAFSEIQEFGSIDCRELKNFPKDNVKYKEFELWKNNFEEWKKLFFI